MPCWRSCKASADRFDQQHCESTLRASAQRRDEVRKVMILAAATLAFTSLNARAQTDLSAYTDANGYLDVQKLTCAQLAGTWQEDADKLMVWYSGWYNGLAKKASSTSRAACGSSTRSSYTARPTRISGSSTRSPPS